MVMVMDMMKMEVERPNNRKRETFILPSLSIKVVDNNYTYSICRSSA